MGWIFLLLGFEQLWTFSIYSQKDMPETTAILGVVSGLLGFAKHSEAPIGNQCVSWVLEIRSLLLSLGCPPQERSSGHPEALSTSMPFQTERFPHFSMTYSNSN